MWYRRIKTAIFDTNDSWNPFEHHHDLQLFPDDDEYDDKYQSHDDLQRGLEQGKLLVHARRPDNTDFKYGIYPSAGDFLKSTEHWQNIQDEHGDGPELTFFSDGPSWAKSPYNQAVFVRKHPTIQKSLGNGSVQLHDGQQVKYHYSPMADYDNPLFRDEPAGVESGDWYSNKDQSVVGVINRKQ